MAALDIELVTTGEQTTLRLTGELDMAAAPELITKADAAAATPGLRALVFDMTAVTFLDSAGVGAMVVVDRECRARRVAFRITGAGPRIRKTLELVGLENWFETDD